MFDKTNMKLIIRPLHLRGAHTIINAVRNDSTSFRMHRHSKVVMIIVFPPHANLSCIVPVKEIGAVDLAEESSC